MWRGSLGADTGRTATTIWVPRGLLKPRGSCGKLRAGIAEYGTILGVWRAERAMDPGGGGRGGAADKYYN